MENLHFFLLLIVILILGSFISIIRLVFSSNKNRLENEKTEEEEQLKYRIRRKEAANKAALAYLMVKEEIVNPKTLHIDSMAVDKKHRVSVFGLKERHRVQRQRTKAVI